MLTTKQESPHEHQQNLLLSRIITNVVSVSPPQSTHTGGPYGIKSRLTPNQEKLNEAVVVMNRTLQVRPPYPNSRLSLAKPQRCLTAHLSRTSTFKT